jgi:hypothetical protein
MTYQIDPEDEALVSGYGWYVVTDNGNRYWYVHFGDYARLNFPQKAEGPHPEG